MEVAEWSRVTGFSNFSRAWQLEIAKIPFPKATKATGTSRPATAGRARVLAGRFHFGNWVREPGSRLSGGEGGELQVRRDIGQW